MKTRTTRVAGKGRLTKLGKTEKDVVNFYKVSGAGNHFVLLNARNESLPLPVRVLVRALCVHGHSVGADGVLFLKRSSVADLGLVYYNADGSKASMCGNGTRCAAAFAYEKDLAGKTMTLETSCGIIEAKVGRASVELNMGRPRGLRAKVVVSTSAGKLVGSVVNTGVPHFVIVVEDVRGLDVDSLGRELRSHRAFRPQGVNVDFVEVTPTGSLVVRTYERGVEAETLACGTGAVAAAVCLGLEGRVKSPVKILTWGGSTLRVRYADNSNPLSAALLEGPAQVVFEGRIRVSVLKSITARSHVGE